MPRGTVPGFKATVSRNVILIVQTLFAGLTDEAGNATLADGSAFAVPVTNEYPSIRGVTPSVQVQVLFGDIANRMGGPLLSFDAGHNPVYGVTATGSVITLFVRALSDAQRTYIKDILTAGILANFYLDPATGWTYDGAIGTLFQNAGVVWRALQKEASPPPVPSDPRPEDQHYDASLPILCDISVSWSGAPRALPVGGIGLQSTDPQGNVQSTTPLPA